MRVLYFDYPSLAACLAVVRAERALQRNASEGLAFGGFDALGLDQPVDFGPPQRGEFTALRQDAFDEGLVVVEPVDRPATTAAHVVGDLADEQGAGRAWRRTLIEGYWCHHWSLSDVPTLLTAAEQVGLDAPQVRARLADRSWFQAVGRRRASVHRRGVGGVPALEIDGGLVPALLSDEQWDLLLQSW